MSNTSRTNASDSDKMPTRKQIAALVKAWADGKTVTVYREHVELFGERPEDQTEEDRSTPVPLDGLILILSRIGAGSIDRKKLQAFLRGNRQPTWPSLGRFRTVTVPATTEAFVVSELIHKATQKDIWKGVRAIDLGDNFSFWFKNKREEPRGKLELYYRSLRGFTADAALIEVLGGKDATETTIAAVWHLMEQQPNGERGVLLTDDVNIFRVSDAQGVVRAVRVRRSDGAWAVGAFPVEEKCSWASGRVFYCAPDPAP